MAWNERLNGSKDQEEEDVYEVEAIVDSKVSEGQQQDGHRKGTRLCE